MRETSTCSTYVHIHWSIIECALTENQTHSLGIWESLANQLSCPAKAVPHCLQCGACEQNSLLALSPQFLNCKFKAVII